MERLVHIIKASTNQTEEVLTSRKEDQCLEDVHIRMEELERSGNLCLPMGGSGDQRLATAIFKD